MKSPYFWPSETSNVPLTSPPVNQPLASRSVVEIGRRMFDVLGAKKHCLRLIPFAPSLQVSIAFVEIAVPRLYSLVSLPPRRHKVGCSARTGMLRVARLGKAAHELQCFLL